MMGRPLYSRFSLLGAVPRPLPLRYAMPLLLMVVLCVVALALGGERSERLHLYNWLWFGLLFSVALLGLLLGQRTSRPPRPERREGRRTQREPNLVRDAALTMRNNLTNTVRFLYDAMELHRATVWSYHASEGAGHFVRKECCGNEAPLCGEVSADRGVLGIVVKSRKILNMNYPSPRTLSYFRSLGEAEPLSALIIVPIFADEQRQELIAVLSVERKSGAFDESDEGLLQIATKQVENCLKSDQVISMLERTYRHQERLYHASEKIKSALTIEQVCKESFVAIRQLFAYDFAAVTLYDSADKTHQVTALDGPRASGGPGSGLHGYCFTDRDTSLVTLAIKNQCVVQRPEEPDAVIFGAYGERLFAGELRSLLVLPLSCFNQPIGSIVLASGAKDAFTDLQIVRLLSNQIAISLYNARTYLAMERLATLDGLTGLLNRRVFQEKFSELRKEAERRGKELTVIMGDVDHFKKINDTHGHAAGDEVLKQVAQSVQKQAQVAQAQGVVARYGGEEFIIAVLGGHEAGEALAESIRREIEKLKFAAQGGFFGCSMSLGVAHYPEHNDTGKLPIFADRALYTAKQGGRNRVVVYR